MLSKTEYLLFKLSEECGEVTQEASKCGIYGVDERYTREHDTNWERVRQEVHDVLAVYLMLAHHLGKDDEGEIDGYTLCKKVFKVEEWMEFCRAAGTLEKEDD